MSDTTKCAHANYDDYSDRCEDCGYEPETCWNCSEPAKAWHGGGSRWWHLL